MAKKSKRVPRYGRREIDDALKFIEIRLRARRGEVALLAELLKQREIEWFALRPLVEPLQKAGIKPKDGWF